MADINSARKNLTVAEIIVSFFVVVILNIGVLILSNFRDDFIFYKLLYTARLTMFLFNIAFCLYILPGTSETKYKYWLLFWTGSFISYAVHIYYSFFIYFEGSLSKFYDAQGVFVATLNVIATLWWLLDIILSWFSNSNTTWIWTQRTGVQIYLFILFFASTVILHNVDHKETFVVLMGVLLGISSAVCLFIRIRSGKKTVLSN